MGLDCPHLVHTVPQIPLDSGLLSEVLRLLNDVRAQVHVLALRHLLLSVDDDERSVFQRIYLLLRNIHSELVKLLLLLKVARVFW